MRASLLIVVVAALAAFACDPVEPDQCKLLPGAPIADHPDHPDFCPSDCTDPGMITASACQDSAGAPVCRDEGHEGDPCGTTTFEGTKIGNIITWCGPGPNPEDDDDELRWDYCPCFLDVDGNPKVPGYSPLGQYWDCVPNGCQNITFLPSECNQDTKYCSRCDNSGSTPKLIECDYNFLDYDDPTRVGYFKISGSC
jgi:hypothetical protein